MSNENQKAVAPGTAKTGQTNTQPPAQQNQGNAKPGTKPADQQK